MLKQIKLRSLLLISILVMTVITFSTAIGIISYKARYLMLEDADQMAGEMGNHYGLQVGDHMDSAFRTAIDLKLMLEGMVASHNTNRESVNLVLQKILENNPGFLGIWTCWEPDAFDGSDGTFSGTTGHDGTGRFIPYWYRSGDEVSLSFLEGYDQTGTGDYYLMAKNSGNTVILDPFSYEIEGKEILMTTISVPVKKEGKFLGAVGVDIGLDNLATLVQDIHPFKTGYSILLSNNGTIVGDGRDSEKGENRLGEKLGDSRDLEDVEAVRKGKVLKKINFSSDYDDNMLRFYLPIRIGSTDTPWSLNLNIPEKTIHAKANVLTQIGGIVGGISLVLISVIVLLLATRISRPISLAVEKMKQVAGGDLTSTIDQQFNIKEISDLRDSINTMIDDISNSVIEIRGVSSEVGVKAEEMSSASEESTAAIEEVTSLTGKTSASTQETASTVEETNASAEEVSNGAQSAAQAASEAGNNAVQISTAANEGGKAVEEMVGLITNVESASRSVGRAVNDLAESVSGVSSFVEIITQIADQTNLLALNAAIEAARAGDAGRGFAVVAEEVRKLAEESNEAATKVGKIIEEISRKTDNALQDHVESGEHVEQLVQKADLTRQVIQDVVSKVVMITDSIQTIAATTEEQSASTEEMTAAMENISKSTQEVAQNVEDINASMEEQAKVAEAIALDAEELVKLSRRMQEAVIKFKVVESEKGIDNTKA